MENNTAVKKYLTSQLNALKSEFNNIKDKKDYMEVDILEDIKNKLDREIKFYELKILLVDKILEEISKYDWVILEEIDKKGEFVKNKSINIRTIDNFKNLLKETPLSETEVYKLIDCLNMWKTLRAMLSMSTSGNMFEDRKFEFSIKELIDNDMFNKIGSKMLPALHQKINEIFND